MGVSIQMNASMMGLVPHTLSVVEKNNVLAARLDLFVVLHTCKCIGRNQITNVVGNHVVMITKDDIDVAVQSPSRVFEITVGHEGKVTKMVNRILRLDQCIPALDKSLIHLIHVHEWTFAVLNDVFVSPMSIGDEV